VGTANAARKWAKAIEGLAAWHARLREVQIEQQDWSAILAQYDHDGTLFYLDPPYVPDTRNSPNEYTHEFTLADHEALVRAVLAVRGYVVLSGFDHPVYRPLEAAGWRRVCREVPIRASNRRVAAPSRRLECLWLSPNILPQLQFF